MRSSIGVVLGVLVVAGAAHADVRIGMTGNGRKVIYNSGPPRGATASGSDLKWLAKRHDRASKYDPIIERYAARYDVDPTLVRAVIQVESNFNPNCVSHKGARGLMQLMPATARRFGVTKIHDAEQNIHGGVRYLSYLKKLFNDDLSRILAGYNAGENAVLKYGGIPPYAETSTYVKRALTVYHGRPFGDAISFAGRRTGKKLRGGFGAQVIPPVAAAMIPGAKYLGTN
ncbi:MAG TPA: lytic transglycosylase domain-containing protein [Thermoanaerobaculia bacterium]|jgi:soluble lytic murein transglycosylase-like protein|nr:lytic transglycosylase domain-containing protein [Thermoanaerobaculia bacterium]